MGIKREVCNLHLKFRIHSSDDGATIVEKVGLPYLSMVH